MRLSGLPLILAAACALSGALGCAKVTQHNRDTPLFARRETKVVSDWTISGVGALVRGPSGELTGVNVTGRKSKVCLITDIDTVDRTVVTERELNNSKSRRLAYPMGALGAAGAVTNTVFAVQAKDEDEATVLGILAGIGYYLSIALITQIVLELSAIDTEEHIGQVELPRSRRDPCEEMPAAGERVRLLRTRGAAVAEAALDPKGEATLPVDGASLRADAIYALEVSGVIVGYIELPAAKRPASVASPP